MIFDDLSPAARKTLSALATALPTSEWRAVELWLGTFYRFQLEWLLDFNRFSLILKSRQIGASHTIAGAAVLWALVGETTTVISLGQREADEVVDKARKHAEALQAFGSEWARFGKQAAQKLEFASGGRILSLPNTSAGRSFSGNVILDEVAYYDRPEEVWDGAGGTALHGYRIRVLSTPNGAGDFWHGMWTDPKQHQGYTKHAVTLDDAIADGLPVNIEDCWKLARGDERIFGQLFRCAFIDGQLQYLPTEALDACTVDDTYAYDGVCYAGMDVGRTNDRTELVIVRRDADGVRWTQYAESCKRTAYQDIERLAALAFSTTWNVKRLCIDATGMGAFPAEQLQKRFGRMRVEPVQFTAQSKEDLATGLYSAFTDATVRIPAADKLLRADLLSIRRIVTSAGNVRYDAPQTSDGHGDRAWAFALALHACSGPDRRRHEVS